MNELSKYESAIVRNADWFMGRQTREGFVDAAGDEFYGVRGDATLVGHSVTVRCYAGLLTGEERYFDSARRSLDWLAARQDDRGGWRRHSAFTLDGAQCVFEGFDTYQRVTGDRRYFDVLVKAAERMIAGTLSDDGTLRLADLIEVGEYAHFALLAWKTTGEERFHRAGERLVRHLERNFDETEGMWLPFDPEKLRQDTVVRALRPMLRFASLHLPLKGRFVARMSEHLAAFAAAESFPQYAMSLMDAEALIDTLDGSCAFPLLETQARAAVHWAEANCAGPFPGSLVESRRLDGRPPVYPIPIINDTRVAALWPTSCLLITYCGLREQTYERKARTVADRILAMQDEAGGFHNFQSPDGSTRPLQSGNVNFYASMALWLFNEVYDDGGSRRRRLFT